MDVKNVMFDILKNYKILIYGELIWENIQLFMSNPCTNMVADTIEELYTNFKIFVDGFYNQDIDMDEGISE